jgi:hypothetical protein
VRTVQAGKRLGQQGLTTHFPAFHHEFQRALGQAWMLKLLPTAFDCMSALIWPDPAFGAAAGVLPDAAGGELADLACHAAAAAPDLAPSTRIPIIILLRERANGPRRKERRDSTAIQVRGPDHRLPICDQRQQDCHRGLLAAPG